MGYMYSEDLIDDEDDDDINMEKWWITNNKW
jgi:hypothetical protein